jgi:uncharacterized protein (UPF0303 family)
VTPEEHRSRADAIAAEEKQLDFARFGFADALAIGRHAIEHTPAPVIVRITVADIVLFAGAMDGTSANNQIWLDLKAAAVRQHGHSSLWLHHDLRAKGRTLAATASTLSPMVDVGGGVPIIIGGRVVGCAGVSGLPHEEDHALMVAALRARLEGRAG